MSNEFARGELTGLVPGRWSDVATKRRNEYRPRRQGHDQFAVEFRSERVDRR